MIKKITSRENQIFKLCRQLQAKKYRDKYGLFIAEGPNQIRDCSFWDGFKMSKLAHSGTGLAFPKPDTIVMCEGYLEKSRDFKPEDFSDEQMAPGGWLADVKVVEMPRELFYELVDTETSQGIFAIVTKPIIPQEAFLENARGGNILVMDRLQDPGNIGTIIRTADAAGYRGVVAIKGCGDLYSPKVVRAAAGSVFRVPVLFADTPEQAAGLLKNSGHKLVATCFDTDHWYYDVDLSKNIGLIIGNEGNGISDELLALADEKIKIPMTGTIESLNAAVAAGILMYETVRRGK